MTVLITSGIVPSLWRAQFWAFERLVSFGCQFGDLRLAAATVIARSLRAAADALVRSVIGQALKGARFVHDITAAATMVAAAWH